MLLLAHSRSAFALSNATYGSPRMTRELRHDGITIGRHRGARLMRKNALQARQRQRLKRTTDSLYHPVAPTCQIKTSTQRGRTRNGVPTSPMSGHARSWLYLAVVIDLFARRVVGWASATGSIRNWRCWPYAGPSPCGVHPPGSFTTRTVAANTAPSSTRLS